jgi:hypothetical protein
MDIGLTQLNVANARSCLNAGTYGTTGGRSGLGQPVAAAVAEPNRPVEAFGGKGFFVDLKGRPRRSDEPPRPRTRQRRALAGRRQEAAAVPLALVIRASRWPGVTRPPTRKPARYRAGFLIRKINEKSATALCKSTKLT